MPISPYLRELRRLVGSRLLVLPSVAVALRDAEGRLLLAHDADTEVWVLPGGAVDPGETPADAAVREAWEETGLRVELVRVAGVFGGPELTVRYRNGDEVAYVGTVFEGRVVGGTPRPDGDETTELRWVSEAELGALPLPAWGHVVLPTLFRSDRGTAFQPATWTPDAAS